MRITRKRRDFAISRQVADDAPSLGTVCHRRYTCDGRLE